MDREGVKRFCLTLPGVTLDHPFGPQAHVFKVGGRMFATVWGGVAFKAADIAYAVLTETGRAKPAPYLARAKWVQVDDPADWTDEDMADHLKTAHALIAAKLTKKARVELGLS